MAHCLWLLLWTLCSTIGPSWSRNVFSMLSFTHHPMVSKKSWLLKSGKNDQSVGISINHNYIYIYIGYIYLYKVVYNYRYKPQFNYLGGQKLPSSIKVWKPPCLGRKVGAISRINGAMTYLLSRIHHQVPCQIFCRSRCPDYKTCPDCQHNRHLVPNPQR